MLLTFTLFRILLISYATYHLHRGFFKRHRDFLSTTSNLLEEFTLLLCVTPQDDSKGVVGGDTSIHFFDGAKTFDTTSTGSGILFRKDLEHEGLELTSGQKHIITANIWATRKEESTQVLLVTFPNKKVRECHKTEAQGKGESIICVLYTYICPYITFAYQLILSFLLLFSLASEDDHKLSIEDAANASTSYALPVDILSGMLLTHVQWANRAAEQEGKDQPRVVTYECLDFDFDTFGVVEKVLNRSYVDEKSILAAKECLDYFGPFRYENMLVDLSLEAGEEKTSPDRKKARKDGSTFDRQSTLAELRPLRVKELKMKLSEQGVEWKDMIEKDEMITALCDAMEAQFVKNKSNSKSQSDDDSFDMNLIVCETEARMRVVTNVARALGEPYVPFKILFVEGIMEANCEGDMSIVEVPMMVAACLLGDHDNVFFLRNVCERRSVSPKSFQEIHSSSNFFKSTPADVISTMFSKVSSGDNVDLFDRNNVNYEVRRALKDNGYGLGLKIGLQSSRDIKSEVVDSCLNEAYNMLKHGSSIKTVYLPGLDQDGQKEEECSTSLFHRNEKGEVVFTEKEAERASDFISSIQMEERVKAALQRRRFVLPQQTSGVQAHFCNESVYGSLNVLWVCGVVRMEDGGSEEQTKAGTEVFDVWPSEEMKNDIDRSRNRMRREHAMQSFFY